MRPGEFARLLSPGRPIEVVDVGANPIDGDPPYLPLLGEGLCRVTGFEPQAEALRRLQSVKGPAERYLPYAIADGRAATLAICRSPGMSSLLQPERRTLALFGEFQKLGRSPRRRSTGRRRCC